MAIQPITFTPSSTTPSNQPGNTSTGGIHPITFGNPGQTTQPTSTPAPVVTQKPVATPQVGKPLNFLQQVEKTAANVAQTVMKGITMALTPPSNPTPLKLPMTQTPTAIQGAPSASMKFQTPKVGESLTTQSGAPAPLPGQTTISQAKKPTVWDNVTTFFNNLTGNSAAENVARSQNAYAVAKSPLAQTTILKDFGVKGTLPNGSVNPDVLNQLAKPGGSLIGNSPMETISQQLGIRSMPTDSEFAQMIMTASIGTGLAEAPIATLKALGIFTGVATIQTGLIKALTGGKGTTLSDLAPTNNPTIKNVIDVVDFLGLGLITHGIMVKSPAVFDALTKDVITKYNLPETITIDSKDLLSLGNKQSNDAIKTLNLSTEELTNLRKAALKGESVTVQTPTSQVTKLVDKPYWGKIKSLFNLPATDETLSTAQMGVGQTVTPIAGLLTSGEHTPNDVINAVFQAKAENTPEGKAVLQTASDAQRQGQNIMITNSGETSTATAIPGAEQAKNYVSAQDFASQVYSAKPESQIGLVDAKTITPRDTIDNTSSKYTALKADIQANGIKEPIRIDATTKSPVTVDGSQRTAIAQELGIKIPVIVNKGTLPGLQTIQQVYDQAKGETAKTQVVTQEGQQIVKDVSDMIYSGDEETAKALHDAYTQAGNYVPSFEDIKSQTNQIREIQANQLVEIEKELQAEQQVNRNNNPDDPTNQMIEIAGMMKKHFSAPGAKWKITGKERVYTSVEGYSMKVGGTYTEAVDRLFDATDIEGFKKNVKILADKFDKSFTEIYDRIRSGAIDGADYEQFKTRLNQEVSHNQSILKNSIASKSKADLAKTSNTENRESVQSGAKQGLTTGNEVGNVNAGNAENPNAIANSEPGSRAVGAEGSNAASSSEYILSDNLKITDAYPKDFLGYNIPELQNKANEIGFNLYDALIKRVDSQNNMPDKLKGMDSILDDLYRNPLPSPTEEVLPSQAQKEPVLPGGGVYKGEEDLTIPLLEKLKGRSIVSKQFIEDLTRTKDTKQAEVDIVNSVLKAFPDKVDVVKFAEALKAELLPLTRKPVEESKYERVNLPYDIKGNAVNYQENVYNSPIETNAGNVHFSGESENYFAHTRTDDLDRGDYESADSIGNRTTRRILEIQSDLFQKGNLDRELTTPLNKSLIPKKTPERALQVAKLKPFENTWYQRIIQEEIKAAAIDGKTKLRFPTGDTAMTIEGLNKKDQWKINEVNGVFQDKLTPENLKPGQIIFGENQGRMVVLEKTGETTFKAAPARGLEMENDPTMYQFAMDHGIIDKETGEWNMDKAFANQELMQMYNKAYGETFDVLGKADTTNPIYKFYQNDVAKYLAHYGGKEITDEDGVTWNELPIKRDFMHIPVEAFGSTTLANEFIPGGSGQKVSLEALKGTELENMEREIDWTGQEGFINVGAIDGGEIIKDLKATLEKAKQNQEDKEFGTALRTYFVGERDVRIAETNQLILTAEKLVKLPVQQEALTFMRDFKSRPADLGMILDGTHPYYDAAVERFKKENPDATQKEIEDFAQKILDRGAKLKKMIEQAAKPTEGMQKVDKAMNLYFKGRLEEGKKLGFLDSKVTPEEYIPHLFVPPAEAVDVKPGDKGMYAKKNKIARYFKFAKGRAYKDVVEAYLNGVDPRTLNAFDSMAIYGDQHATVAATKLLIQQLKDTELGKWGSRKSEFIPSDWKPIAPESSLFQNEIPFVTQVNKADLQGAELAKWEKMLKDGIAKEIGDQYVKADVAHQSLFAPEKVVKALMPITDGDYMNKLPLFGKSRLYQAYIKSAELSLSIFHMRAMEITAGSNMGAVGFMKAQIADMNSPKFLDGEKIFIRAGGTSSILGRTIEAYSATRKTTVKSRIPTRKDLMMMTPGLKQMNGFAHFLTYETFNVLQRKLKVTDFMTKDAGWIAKHPNATDAEHYAAQKAYAKEINAAYGGLQWEILGVNKMTQSVLKMLLLAPDWTFSNFFNVKTSFQGGAGGKAARAFWVRAIVIGIVLNQLWSLLMSGQLSDDPTKAYLGKDNVGKKIYTNIGFAGAPADVINLIKNINDYGIEAGFFKSLASKQAPIMRTGTELITNRNYLGQAIIPKGSGVMVGSVRSAVELANGLSPIPFSIQNWFTMLTDPNGKYIPAEYISILLGGGTASHTIPAGQRQVTSGAKKGQLVPASPPGAQRPFWEQVTTGKLTEPKVRATSSKGSSVYKGYK